MKIYFIIFIAYANGFSILITRFLWYLKGQSHEIFSEISKISAKNYKYLQFVIGAYKCTFSSISLRTTGVYITFTYQIGKNLPSLLAYCIHPFLVFEALKGTWTRE